MERNTIRGDGSARVSFIHIEVFVRECKK